MYTYELERHVHIVSDKALVHFKYVFHRVKFVNTLKQFRNDVSQERKNWYNWQVIKTNR